MPVSAVWFDFEDARYGVITLDGVALLGEEQLDGIVLAHAWQLNDRPMLSYVFVGGRPDLSNLYEAHGELEIGYDEDLLLIDIQREVTTIPYNRPVFRRSGLVRGGMISLPPGFDADRYGSVQEAQEKCDQLLRKLDGAGLDRYRRRFDPESLAIMGRLGEPDKRIYFWLAERSVAGARRREFARTFPMLMPTVWAFGAGDCRKAIDDGVSILHSLNATIHLQNPQSGPCKVTPGHLRALRQADWGIERNASSFQQMLPHIPPNKIPIDRESVRACEKLSNLWAAVNTATAGRSYQTLLNGLDQDWAGSLDTMRAEFGRRLDRVDAPWFFDPVDHFFNRVLIPAIALTHLDLATWPVNSALEALSSKLVYRDLNIAGMLRQSERWHASISLANPKCDPALTWDRLFGDYVCEETGLAITCLGSSRELVDEGSPDKDADGFRGLSHCVASYDERCARYECAILSIREQDDGAKGMRVSTVELGINAGGVLTVIQHASFENLAPSEAAEMALARYMDAVNSGEVMGYASRLTMAVPAIPGAWEAAHGHVGVPRMDRTQREAAWALWRPLLSRDFRSMSLDDFATWLINHPKLQIQAAA